MQDHRNGHRCYGNRLSLHEKRAHRQGLHRRGLGLPFAVLHFAGQDYKACRAGTGKRRVIASQWGFHCSVSLHKRELVGARPLHLAAARPFGRLKAPLGLSLLRCARKREVITLVIPFHRSFSQIHIFHTMGVPSQLLLMK